MAVARTPAQSGEPVLMGLSVARTGSCRRALGTAWVAVTVARRPLTLADRDAVVRFVRRPVDELDAERVPLDLGGGLVTTPEQTQLDLVRLSKDTPDGAAVVRDLWPCADQQVLVDLARRSRAVATLRRLRRARR